MFCHGKSYRTRENFSGGQRYPSRHIFVEIVLPQAEIRACNRRFHGHNGAGGAMWRRMSSVGVEEGTQRVRRRVNVGACERPRGEHRHRPPGSSFCRIRALSSGACTRQAGSVQFTLVSVEFGHWVSSAVGSKNKGFKNKGFKKLMPMPSDGCRTSKALLPSTGKQAVGSHTFRIPQLRTARMVRETPRRKESETEKPTGARPSPMSRHAGRALCLRGQVKKAHTGEPAVTGEAHASAKR